MYAVTFEEKGGNRKLEIVENTGLWTMGVFAAKDFARCERAYKKIETFVAAKSKTRINSPEFQDALKNFSMMEIKELFPYLYVDCHEEIYSSDGKKCLPDQLIEGEDYVVCDKYSHEWFWLKGVTYGGVVVNSDVVLYADQSINLGVEEADEPYFLL